MEIHIYKDNDVLSRAAAEWITSYIGETLQGQDRFTWVLSGGNTPRGLYELLAAPPYLEKIQWNKIHVFWGDERVVPFDDPRNNAKMAYDILLNHVPVPSSQIHIMRTDITPEKSASDYDQILHQYFRNAEGSSSASFDLVLLGMGEDGHTLSLFPGTEVVHESQAWVKAFYLQSQEMHRITLTKTIVNRSRAVAFLTTGSNKSKALRQVLEGPSDPDLYPSQVIQPQTGHLYWFVDEAAAAGLSKQ
ncbi:MAG TPA: 6-phosphogluconolactonase [Puia sp.]|jgi:6-phosphogluconolactonase|nr:6-phosphogluconolactonase [Puia sp.]